MDPTEPLIDEIPDVTIESTPVATARRRHGVAGAMLAGGMLGLDEALGLKVKRPDAPVVVSAPTEPVDIDSDGIDLPIDDQTSVFAPPQPRSRPILGGKR